MDMEDNYLLESDTDKKRLIVFCVTAGLGLGLDKKKVTLTSFRNEVSSHLLFSFVREDFALVVLKL
ncbi:hypothetical protein SAMN04487786_3172 [Paenisporosarcina quisquiliarum]|nr:hypothetical protein SAMN04487786_3172 [Paenisporosarcina quisquiliarum]